MALVRAQRVFILGMVMGSTPIVAGLLIKGIEKRICGRILSSIGAQCVIVVATVGQGTRTVAGRAAAGIKIIAICRACHRANPTAAGRDAARVVRGAGRGACPKKGGTSAAASVGNTIFRQRAIQVHGVLTAAIGACKGAVAGMGVAA